MIKQYFFETCKATHPLLLVGLDRENFLVPIGWNDIVVNLLNRLCHHSLKIEQLYEAYGELICETNQDGALDNLAEQAIEHARILSHQTCSVCGEPAIAHNDHTAVPVCWEHYDAAST